MNLNDNLNTSLIDSNGLLPIKTRCFCFYLFCCCFCFKDTHIYNKSFYIDKWRKYLAKGDNTFKKQFEDPFRILMNLWAHKNVIKDLEAIRLNPNHLNLKGLRNDLEFYIPQLCTFLIFGEYEVVEEFLAFLCKACFASFFFAHRIIWFLKSIMNSQHSYNEKYYYNNLRIKDILHLIQTIFKSDSEKKKTCLEKFHFANSKKFFETLADSNMLFIYKSDLHTITTLTDDQKDILIKKENSRTLIDEYCESHYNHICKNKEENKDIEEFTNEKKLKSENVFINIFKTYQMITNDENSVGLQYFKQIDRDDLNLTSFLSTINFVDHLCNICEILRNSPLDNQLKVLQNELMKTNKVLPSNVYLPFMSESIRNYIIVHIPVSEARIFRTKNRAPYLITVELIRIDELIYYLNNIKMSNKTIIEESKKPPKKKDKKFSQSSSKKKNDMKNTINTLTFLQESDISLSKPVIIKNLATDLNFKNKKEDKLKIVEIDDSQESEEEYKKIDEYVKKKVREDNIIKATDNINNSKDQASNFNLTPIESPSDLKDLMKTSKPNENDQEKHEREFNNNVMKETSSDNKIISLQVKKDNQNDSNFSEISNYHPNSKIEEINQNHHILANNNEMTTIKIKEEDNSKEVKEAASIDNIVLIDESILEKKFPVKKKGQKKSHKKSKSKKLYEAIEPNSVIESISTQIDVSNSTKDLIFGEKMESQFDRLKNISPFGNFNTFKIFKVIIKNGEDLRQEQFATQLINEFYQIFQLEEVDIWLKPYEILSTGDNVGLIECVPNSVSLDYLKRKSMNTLSQFYETYFGPKNTESFINNYIGYKCAINEFIKSLAGYSLVCYFLQIKDRHNGNILIDDHGHIIHIDFGFMLSNAPGKGIQFEKAPFKLTKEFVDVIGGVKTENFSKFRKLLWKGFIAASKHYEKILILIEMMYCGHGANLPCFEKGISTIDELRERFIPRNNMKKHDYISHVDSLIEMSIDNWRTKWYDKYQYYFQGIFY